MQYHDEHPQQGMGWPTIFWNHVLTDLTTRSLADVTNNWWIQGNFFRKNRYANIMRVGDIILAAAAEYGID